MLPKLIEKLQLNVIKKNSNLVNKLYINRCYNISALITTTVITLVIIAMRQGGSLQSLELWAYDRLVRLNNQNRQAERLLLVEITDTDIKNQDRWPLTDATLAQLISKLQQHKPTVIGLDIYRDITYPPGTSWLQQQLQKDNVVSIQYLGNGDNRVAAPSGVDSAQIGFNDVVLDTDSRLRRSLMYARLGEEELYSFALRLSLFYLNNNPATATATATADNFKLTVDDNYLYIGDARLKRLQANSGSYRMQPSEALGWQTLLKYQSPDIAPRVSLTEVLEGNIAPDLVKDKVVIIGTTASSINDFFFTPYGGAKTDLPGASVHAQMVNQIISLALGESAQFWFFSEALELLWIGMWSLVGMAIAIRLENPLKIVMVGILGIIFIWVICWLSFIGGGWIPFVPAALGFGLTISSLLLQRLFYSYFYDSLTALPNKTLFIRQLQRLKQSQKLEVGSLVLLCIDLDRFKMLNDALGYRAGDSLLITTACRLRESLDRDTILARVGGDEFAIAKIVADETEALKMLHQLQTQLNVPLELKGIKTSTTVTTGIAVNSLTADFDAENILRSARTAMYQAKASGKMCHLFATTIREQAFKRLQLEADLYEAIEKEEFELYYQPIINLTTEKIAGFEALIRWHSSRRGFVSPGAFIPVAEETGAIIPLGEWVLKEACSQMYQWQQQFSSVKSLFMSVNLSGKQFVQPNLVQIIQNILQLTGLDSSSLKLEITESIVMDNINEAILMLDNLKQLGIQLSMDDFGTGFSSFSYLHRFSMDTLKVDRSFVSNMSHSQKNFEIVSTIIMLAHKLGMDVVAEGIETNIEKIALRNLNCEYGQGYLFAKPLPVAEVEKFLADI